jgi:hypothetical protein
MVSQAAVIAIVTLLILLAGVGIYVSEPALRGIPSENTLSNTSGASSSTTTCADICTMLEAIIAGQFQTSTDKSGTGGTTVTIQGLKVLYVNPESDGDWHVGVADGKVSVFITEIIPRDQAAEGQPPVGAVIEETGTPYCDTVHETEAWHGNTCWEIHPVTAWALTSQGSIPSTTIAARGLKVNITAQDPIAAGSNQTISVSVLDSDGPVKDAPVSIEVTYASGYIRDFVCTTTTDGTCSVSWVIGSNSNPGTFLIDAAVEAQHFTSSFQVT